MPLESGRGPWSLTIPDKSMFAPLHGVRTWWDAAWARAVEVAASAEAKVARGVQVLLARCRAVSSSNCRGVPFSRGDDRGAARDMRHDCDGAHVTGRPPARACKAARCRKPAVAWQTAAPVSPRLRKHRHLGHTICNVFHCTRWHVCTTLPGGPQAGRVAQRRQCSFPGVCFTQHPTASMESCRLHAQKAAISAGIEKLHQTQLAPSR